MTCVDLAARFGQRYRLGWEADGATRSSWPREEWVWLRRVRCRYGVVYPVGGEILAAWTDRRRIGAQLRALPIARVARGDVETVVLFHVDDAAGVFAVLRAYQRRQLSSNARARLHQAGAGTHFAGVRPGTGDDFPARESTQRPREGNRKGSAPAASQGAGNRFLGDPEFRERGPLRRSLPGGLAQGAPASTVEAAGPGWGSGPVSAPAPRRRRPPTRERGCLGGAVDQVADGHGVDQVGGCTRIAGEGYHDTAAAGDRASACTEGEADG